MDDVAVTEDADEPILRIALWSALKVDWRLVREDCRAWSVDTTFCMFCIGSDAMATARLRTCWKSLANLLCPVKLAGGIEKEPISESKCKKWAKPRRAGPHQD